jgi:hypothetical protein
MSAAQHAWPLQHECDAFYGNPRGRNGAASAKWERENLTLVTPPFRMTYGGQKIRGVRIHRKCAGSLSRILIAIWEAADRKQATVDAWGASIYAGAYTYRLMRGSNSLSMHSYGCAIDLDPARNAFHDTTPNFARFPDVVDAFEREGWTWGGRWAGRSCDGMHFQAARVG